MSRAPSVPRAAPPAEPSLSRQLTGLGSPIIWGVLLLVTIEGTLLGLFVVSYFYLRLGTEMWPPAGVPPPELLEPAIAQALLVLSPLPAWLGLRAVAHGRLGPLRAGLPLGLLLVAGYLALKVREYAGKQYLWEDHAYGSMDWTMSGYAALHAGVVLLAGAVIWLLALRGHFGAHRYTGVQALVVYWVFVALGSLLFFATQYLAPHW